MSDIREGEPIPVKERGGYRVVERIGRGSFGDVFLCVNDATSAHVCVKEVDLRLLSPVERLGCLEEVQVLRRLPRHPRIITFQEAFLDAADPNLLLIVLEFANAGDLELHISEYCHHENDVIDNESEALRLFAQIVEGVEFLHANNVLHRDLKTKNIFLFQDHGDSHVRAVLGDFGTSKTLASASALAATIVGSPLYMSPEILDSEPHGMATDIWSLGCILYELLAHRPAFQAPSYPAVVLKITQGSFDPLADGISLPTRELVNRLLQKAPRDRPTAKEILQLSVLESFVTKVQADPVCAPAPDLALVAETTVVTIDNLPVENEREECAADNEVTEVSIPVLPPPAPVCQTSQLPPFTEPPNDVVSPNIDRDISLQPSVSDTVERSAQAKSVRPRRAYPQQTRTRVPGRQFDRQEALPQPPPPPHPPLVSHIAHKKNPKSTPSSAPAQIQHTRASIATKAITKPAIQPSNADLDLTIVGVRVPEGTRCPKPARR